MQVLIDGHHDLPRSGVSASGGDALAQQMALFGEVSQGLPQAK